MNLRALALALLSHLILVLMLVLGLDWKTEANGPLEIMLVADGNSPVSPPPQVKPPEPTPKPEPAPEPKPEPTPEPSPPPPPPPPPPVAPAAAPTPQVDPEIALEQEAKRRREQERLEREMAAKEAADKRAAEDAIKEKERIKKELEIAKITSFDPLGDNEENADQTTFAIDNDLETAWTTVNYNKANMGGKAGVGLLLDLGASKDVSSVSVTFTSVGQTAEIYVTELPEVDFATAIKFGDNNPNEISSEITATKAVTGRYVLIWLTPDLPKATSGKYQGGVVQVDVTS
jgi:hypothetical protein